MRLRDATQELIPGYSVFALSSQAKLRAEIGREALMEDDDDAENEDELTKVDRLYLGESLLCSLSRMAKSITEPYFDTSEVCPVSGSIDSFILPADEPS